MGSTSSKTIIDPAVLEEASMYCLNVSKTDLIHYYKIFIAITSLEHDDDLEKPSTSANQEDEEKDEEKDNNINETMPTMRFEEFLAIPEFSYHPLVIDLFNYSIRLEPYFNEKRLTYAKFSKLLSILSDVGSMEDKVKLGYFLIAGEDGRITLKHLSRYINKLTSDLTDEVLKYACKQIWIELKSNSTSKSSFISLAEYRRSVTLADDFSSKLYVSLKYRTSLQYREKNTKRLLALEKEAAKKIEKENEENEKIEIYMNESENETNENTENQLIGNKKSINLPNLLKTHSKLRSAALRAKKKVEEDSTER